MNVLLRIWQLAGELGGDVALVFIVVVAAGLGILCALYLASALVVLERFARVGGSRWVVGLFALLAAAAATGLVQAARGPEAWDGGPTALLPVALAVLAFSACSIAAVRLALVRGGGVLRGQVVVAVFGLAVGLWLGARPIGFLAVAPALVVGAIALGLRLVASRREHGFEGELGTFERNARWAAAALLAGALLALAVPALPAATVATSLLSVLLGVVLLGLGPLAAAGLVGLVNTAEWFIAVRYLVAKRRQVFISAITGICVAGIAAGVWLIVVVLSVMNGFEITWRDEILGNRPHFVVQRADGPLEDWQPVLAKVRAVPDVVAAGPYLDADGMVRGKGGEIFSVRVRGILPDSAENVTRLSQDMILGSLAALGSKSDDGVPGIVIGNQLAVSAGVNLGDELMLVSPFGGPPTPLGPAPRLSRFRVVGIYQTSFFQYDEVTTYTSLAAAQAFRGAGHAIDGIEARTHDDYRSRSVAAEVLSALGPGFVAKDWKDFFPAFFQALKTERMMMFLLLTMIMVVAAFLIVATLVMMIMEKSSDISILKAMGAEDEAIERIFAIEGTLIGVGGAVLGLGAGVAVTQQLGWIQRGIEAVTGMDALPQSVYQFSSLPSDMDPVQIAVVMSIALVLSLGATLLPSRQGARLDPAEGLRHE